MAMTQPKRLSSAISGARKFNQRQRWQQIGKERVKGREMEKGITGVQNMQRLTSKVNRMFAAKKVSTGNAAVRVKVSITFLICTPQCGQVQRGREGVERVAAM